MRTVICGAPNSGKTTLAAKLAEGRTVYHTDDLLPMGLDESAPEVAAWLDSDGPWVIEGVTAIRGLRLWLDFYDGKPCDQLVMVRGGDTRDMGVWTILAQIRRDLEARGVVIETVFP